MCPVALAHYSVRKTKNDRSTFTCSTVSNLLPADVVGFIARVGKSANVSELSLLKGVKAISRKAERADGQD